MAGSINVTAKRQRGLQAAGGGAEYTWPVEKEKREGSELGAAEHAGATLSETGRRRDLSQAAPAGLTMLTTMERGAFEKCTGRWGGNLKKKPRLLKVSASFVGMVSQL